MTGIHPAPSTMLLGRQSLKEGEPVTPLAKTVICTIRGGEFGLNLDNIEGLALGPVLDGRQTLVFASDNNFHQNGQISQFVVFGLDLR